MDKADRLRGFTYDRNSPEFKAIAAKYETKEFWDKLKGISPPFDKLAFYTNSGVDSTRGMARDPRWFDESEDVDRHNLTEEDYTKKIKIKKQLSEYLEDVGAWFDRPNKWLRKMTPNIYIAAGRIDEVSGLVDKLVADARADV